MLQDIGVGIVNVLAQYLAQLIHPLLPFRLVGPDQRVHGQHVLGIIVA